MEKVYNLESLKEGDFKTYETLHDTIQYAINKPNDFEYDLVHIDNSEDLFKTFSHIENEVEGDLTPILHFDVHGSPDGIELRSDELIDWDRIIENFVAININCGLKLFLSVGACFGISAVQIIDAYERAPFSIIVAPNREVYPDDLNEFYRELFKHNFQDDLDTFLNESPLIPDVFSIASVETLYHKIFNLEDQKKGGTLYKYYDQWKKNNRVLVENTANEESLKELFEIDMHLRNEKEKSKKSIFLCSIFIQRIENSMKIVKLITN